MSLVKQGNKAFREGNYSVAIINYEKAIKELPSLSKYITPNLELARMRTGQTKTLECFKKAVQGIVQRPKTEDLQLELYQESEQEASLGVSLIVSTLKEPELLKRCLSSFFTKNTYSPIELITIEREDPDGMAGVLVDFIDKTFLRRIVDENNQSFSALIHEAVKASTYPHLLFINNTTEFQSDPLPQAMTTLLADKTTKTLSTNTKKVSGPLKGIKKKQEYPATKPLVLGRKEEFIKSPWFTE